MQTIATYRKLESQDVRLIGKRAQNGIETHLMVMQTPFGYRRVAELLAPQARSACPAILYLHWYEPGSPDSDRSQFQQEAKELAQCGAVALLIETLWSDRDFFIKRTQTEDLQNSVEEAVNIRRALDLLFLQANIDEERLALVGHDFGGMYGVLAGSLDRRPTCYVVMAATPRFPDWYLYGPRLEGQTREEFQRQFAPLDPVTQIASLSPASVLFQFGTDDPHVPNERAEEFFGAASQPKEIKWYQAGHGLNEAATQDRTNWLKEKLNVQEKQR